jgi:hypothetical protein
MGALEDIARLMSAPSPSPYAASNAPPLTRLSPLDELAFRQWVKEKSIPFDPNAAQADYDMRGFYQGLQQQNPRAVSAVNANDGRLHFPDYWKTPLHQTFSGESRFAGPVAPKWNDQDQLISPGGRILFDEKAR